MENSKEWIEKIPIICKEYGIKFNFGHVECIDNALFLWNDGYNHVILKLNLLTRKTR